MRFEVQEEIMKFIHDREKISKGGIIAVDMGLGKSRPMIESSTNSLIVSEKKHLTHWQSESDKFNLNKKIFVYHKDYNKNLESQILSKFDIVVCTYTQLNLSNKAGNSNLFKQRWDKIFYDEGHKLRNPESDVYKSALKLKCNSNFIATGTPSVNSKDDLMVLLRLAGFKKSDNIDDYIFRKFNKKELFEHEIHIHRCILSTKELNLSRNILKNSDTRSPFSIISDLTKLSISGHLLNKNIPFKSSSKIMKMMNIINKIPKDEKVVVFSRNKTALILCHKIYKNSVNVNGDMSSTQQISRINKFLNNNSIKILFINTLIGSTSLNLQRANHVIFLDVWWNNTDEIQGCKRVLRYGQTRKVHIHKLICPELLDQDKICLSKQKNTTMYQIKNNLPILDNYHNSLSLSVLNKKINSL